MGTAVRQTLSGLARIETLIATIGGRRTDATQGASDEMRGAVVIVAGMLDAERTAECPDDTIGSVVAKIMMMLKRRIRVTGVL